MQSHPELQWHPAAAPLKTLQESGRLTVMPGVGYTSPNQSHFTSRHFYEVGDLNEAGQVGWMGRWLDRNGRADNPLQGLSLDSSLAPSLAAAVVPTAAVSNPANFRLNADEIGPFGTAMNTTYGAMGRLADRGRRASRRRAARRRRSSASRRASPRSAARRSRRPPRRRTRPTTASPAGCKVLAKMLHMGLPIRCVALDGPGGYDTHENQATSLQNNLDEPRQLARRLPGGPREPAGGGPLAAACSSTCGASSAAAPPQNGTGTDHGAAGASLLMGAASTIAKTGQGEFPGVVTLDRSGNLRNTVDFRVDLQVRARGLAGRRPDRRAAERGLVPEPRADQGVVARRPTRLLALALAALLALAAAPAADAKKRRGCKKRACRGLVAKSSVARGLPAAWLVRSAIPRRPGRRPAGVAVGARARRRPRRAGGAGRARRPPPPPPVPGSSPWFLQVSADDTDLDDMHLYLSRGTVRAGEVTIEFNNRAAQDPHNLRLRRGGASFGFDVVDKGEAAEKAFTLAAGTYTLFCSLAGHEAAGMKAQLVVADQ